MWRAWLPLMVLVLLVVAFWYGMQRNPNELPSVLIGRPAPSFTLPTLHDPRATLSDEVFRGQVSLFNVWATWCVGCRQEHALLVQFARNSHIPVYGLNWKDDRDTAIRWLEEGGDPYAASGFDAQGKVAIDYGVYGAPETFVIDRQGVIRYRHVGPLTPAALENTILPLVRKLESE
jgi:cytochrome c biogenesis protein CcmG/thiol:disulfide interchange protein DsbE